MISLDRVNDSFGVMNDGVDVSDLHLHERRFIVEHLFPSLVQSVSSLATLAWILGVEQIDLMREVKVGRLRDGKMLRLKAEV
jgi:hypothetical protein